MALQSQPEFSSAPQNETAETSPKPYPINQSELTEPLGFAGSEGAITDHLGEMLPQETQELQNEFHQSLPENIIQTLHTSSDGWRISLNNTPENKKLL